MASQAEVLENRLQNAGRSLYKLGAIIGEFGIDQPGGEIETPEQATDLIKGHIERIKGKQYDQSENLERRTQRLLDTLRSERDIQNKCKGLFENTIPELKSQSNFIKCSLDLKYTAFEEELLKRKCALEKGNLRILMTGEISAGKSSILNILMGGNYMPVAHGHCTVIPCEVQHSNEKRAVLHYVDTSTTEISLVTNERDRIWLQLRECIETGEDKLQKAEEKRLKKVVLYWNFPFLNDKHQGADESHDHDKIINGITFVDAPGIHDTDRTYSNLHEYIEDCDAFIFVINTSQHAGIDRDRLVRLMNDVRSIYEKKNGIFTPKCAMFVCNKWDFVCNTIKKKLQLEILNKLQACWSKVTNKQVVPFSGSEQVLESVQQSDCSEEYVSFYEQLCSFVEMAARVKSETNCWWLSELIERTHAIHCNKQSILQNYTGNKERVLEQLQNDMDAVAQAQEKRDSIVRKLTGTLNDNLKSVQKCLQEDLKNKRPSLAKWDENDIPRREGNERWQDLNKKINKNIEMRIQAHILEITQITSIRERCSKEVSATLETVIQMYAALENQLTFKREIRKETLKDFAELMSYSDYELTWKDIAGVIVAVAFPLAPIAVLLVGVIDSVRTTTMLNDEGLFEKNPTSYMQRQTEIIVDNIVSSSLQHESEGLLDDQLKQSRRVLNFFRSRLNVQYQLLQELMNEISSNKPEENTHGSIQELSESIQQLLISDKFRPEVDKSMVCLGEIIGEGSFGKVHKAKLRGDIEDVAVKVLKWPRGEGECPSDPEIYRECLNFRKLSVKPESSRKNVVDFYGEYVEVNPDVYSLHIIMELFDGSLDSLIQEKMLTLPWCSDSRKGFPGKDQTQIEGIGYVLHLAEQAAMGIQFLHDNNVVHRDIKPQNFLIKSVKEETQVKICDFGLSREQDMIKTIRCVGTIPYNAPEVLAGHINTFASDIYSFGLVIWELWYGEKVFKDLKGNEVCDPRRKAPQMNDIQPPIMLMKLLLSM